MRNTLIIIISSILISAHLILLDDQIPGEKTTRFGKNPVYVSDVRTISLSTNAGTNGGTSGVEVTGLNMPVGPGTYCFQYFIRYQSNTANTGVKFGVNHTGTTSAFAANIRWHESTSAASTGAASQAAVAGTLHGGGSTRTKSTSVPNLGPTISVDVINSDMLAIIEGYIIVTGVGDLELYHGSEVAVGTTQVMQGSSLILTKTN